MKVVLIIRARKTWYTFMSINLSFDFVLKIRSKQTTSSLKIIWRFKICSSWIGCRILWAKCQRLKSYSNWRDTFWKGVEKLTIHLCLKQIVTWMRSLIGGRFLANTIGMSPKAQYIYIRTVSSKDFGSKLVRPNEPDQPNPTQPKFGPWWAQPDPTQPEFGPWGPNLTRNRVQIEFIQGY